MTRFGLPLSRPWQMVFGLMLVQTVSSGFGFYNMSVYVTVLASALDEPLANLSFAVSLFFLAGGLAGIYVARYIDVLDVRWIMTIGTLVAGAALLLIGHATSLWMVYVLFIVFGLGNTGISLVVGTTLITRWFPGQDRSVALAVASTGLSLGGVTLTPLTALLFNELGVAGTMPWVGAAFILLVLPIALFVIRMPAVADGVAQSEVAAPMVYREAIRQRFFIMVSLGYIACMAAQVGGIAHVYGRVEGLGGFAAASLAIQVLSICSILGRFAGGVVATRVPIRMFVLGGLALQAIGLLGLSLATEPLHALIATGIFGASVGNLLMSQPLWLAQAYTGSVYPRVFALSSALTVIGVAAGPYVMGVLIDAVSYAAAFSLSVVVCLLAAVCMISAGTVSMGLGSKAGRR